MSHIAPKGWDRRIGFPFAPASERPSQSRSGTHRALRRDRPGRFRRTRNGAHWDSENETWRATVVLDGHPTLFGSFESGFEAAAASEAARHDLTAMTEPEPGRTARGAMLAVAHAVRAIDAVGMARVFRAPTPPR